MTAEAAAVTDGREAVRRHVRAVLDHVEAGLVLLLELDTPHLAAVTAAVTLVAGLMTWWLCCSGSGSSKAVLKEEAGSLDAGAADDGESDEMNRFRKRDKIAFMGRKVYKNAKVETLFFLTQIGTRMCPKVLEF